jgi:ribosome-associated heat shock protein Hsp15
MADTASGTMRLDKWLWAARFFKTRALAVEQIAKGRVTVNQQAAKPARDVRLGDVLEIRQGDLVRTVSVTGLSMMRGPAAVAQALYAETEHSLAQRQRLAELRRQGVEPAQALAHGRPTKRDRRDLADWRRWSASIDD